MDFLEQIKPIVEERLLKANLRYTILEEPDKNSLFFEVKTETNLYILTFWNNQTVELTKINKATDELFSESIEIINQDSLGVFLDKHLV